MVDSNERRMRNLFCPATIKAEGVLADWFAPKRFRQLAQFSTSVQKMELLAR